ncbi:hypothetical protein [Anaeromyxobacter terrae]|uniref:hypothetical protein n=1 Tax=Anaeromyxobacter terrae TaxID=2925406 RepID=UPI001F57DE84|nr:hypothetical protein [Anaeromyxobacter sp. SG22]
MLLAPRQGAASTAQWYAAPVRHSNHREKRMATRPQQPKDPLLANAIEAIENGIEDFTEGRPQRVSSALRNLCAGVLLLLKENLRQLSPPGTDGALIFKKLVPKPLGGAVVFVGKGKSTVDLEDIRERLEPLGFNVEWQRIFRLRDLRNDVEHHRSVHPHTTMQEAIANTFVVVVRILEQLGLEPAHELSEKTWAEMLAQAETFKALEDECRKSIDRVIGVPDEAQETLRVWRCCPECSSELIQAIGTEYADLAFVCRACGARSELPGVLEKALEGEYAGDAYEAAKDGDEPPLAVCPNCCSETFVVASDVCLVCGEGRSYENCNLCGNSLSVEEQDFDGLCSYCHHRMTKDD